MLAGEEYPGDVDREGRVPGSQIQLHYAPEVRDTDVVVQHCGGAEACCCLGDDRGDLFLHGDVCLQCQRRAAFVADLFRCTRSFVGIHVDRRHLGARPGKRQSGCLAVA